MNKSYRKFSAFLVSGAAVALLLGSAGISAGPTEEKKVHICHFPPGNIDNVQVISISVNAENTHVSHHDDWVVDDPASCFLAKAAAVAPNTLSVLACINRSGRTVGREIRTSPTGLTSNRRMGCELEL